MTTALRSRHCSTGTWGLRSRHSRPFARSRPHTSLCGGRGRGLVPADSPRLFALAFPGGAPTGTGGRCTSVAPPSLPPAGQRSRMPDCSTTPPLRPLPPHTSSCGTGRSRVLAADSPGRFARAFAGSRRHAPARPPARAASLWCCRLCVCDPGFANAGHSL